MFVFVPTVATPLSYLPLPFGTRRNTEVRGELARDRGIPDEAQRRRIYAAKALAKRGMARTITSRNGNGVDAKKLRRPTVGGVSSFRAEPKATHYFPKHGAAPNRQYRFGASYRVRFLVFLDAARRRRHI